ncbi:hypothetical protein, partial [Neisseria flavescens]|uniref:hypothetical protein n=1 Tax=Neisseria flavescens TaxID=484 RepID=UPI003C73479B
MPYWLLCKRPSEKKRGTNPTLFYMRKLETIKKGVSSHALMSFQTALRLKKSTSFVFAAKAVVRLALAFKAFAAFFETVSLFETV